jgi:hypothetical protein
MPDANDAEFDKQSDQVASVAALVMGAISKHIPDDGHSRGDAMTDLVSALHDATIDIITQEDRAKAGLPPRSAAGWTDQELRIIDAMRIQEMMLPFERTLD